MTDRREYLFIRLNQRRVVGDPLRLSLLNDEAAKAEAQDMFIECDSVEVWEGTRLVAELKADTGTAEPI